MFIAGIMRKIIMRTVGMSGLQLEKTEQAGNGNEAIDKLNASPVDIMLCDVNMPEMKGTELHRKHRSIDPHCSMRTGN
jgi:YesN/AraC family two-component response regulator